MAFKAKKKSKSKAKKKSPMVGHNSAGADDSAEILKVAKAQRSLDRRRREANAEFRQEHKTLTDRLSGIGVSRQAFLQPYNNYCRLADSENDEDAKTARENNLVYLAEQRRCYDALSVGEQMDWLSLVQDAEAIQKLREEAERKAAEIAAESSDEPEETPAMS